MTEFEKKRQSICLECGAMHFDYELLIGMNPFDNSDDVWGCPSCKQINTQVTACSHIDCKGRASNGQKHDDGVYRWTCYEHSPPINIKEH